MAASRLGIKVPKNVFSAGNAKFAEGGDFNNVDLEPGKYICILLKGKAIEIKGIPKIVFDLEVAGDSDQKGGTFSIFHTLEEERVVYLNRMLKKLGQEELAAELSEDGLADFLDELEANPVVVRITAQKSKDGDFVNYFVDKLLDNMSVEDARGGAEDSGTDNAADEDAAGGKAGIKPGKGKPAKEEPAEEEPEPEEGSDIEGDELDELDRNKLKLLLKSEKIDFKVTTKTTDDEIRVAIREARVAHGGEPEEEPAEEEEPEPSDDDIVVGKKCNVKIKGKLTPCTVVKIDEATGKVTVKTAKETVTVSAALLSA